MRLSNGELTRWTFSEVGGLDPASFIAPTLIQFKSFDERQIPAFYFRPRTAKAGEKLPVIISTHPRTQSKMEKFGLRVDNTHVRFMPPFGFFDFVALEQSAFCVLSDSGTVQEECALFGVPNVTIRDVTAPAAEPEAPRPKRTRPAPEAVAAEPARELEEDVHPDDIVDAPVDSVSDSRARIESMFDATVVEEHEHS